MRSGLGQEFYVWKFPGSPKRIQVSLDFVERLKREVLEKAQAYGGQGSEIGGLLLGSFSPNGTDVEVLDYLSLPCESRTDRCYALSTPADVERLEAAVASPRDGRVVVGSFRSHLREGLNLDDRDLTVCQIWFSDPAFVFLVIKPAADGGCDAGFFFWDRGQIHSAFSFMEFPFDASLLRRANDRTPRDDEELSEPPAEEAPGPDQRGQPRERRRRAGGWMIAAGVLAVAVLAAAFALPWQRVGRFGAVDPAVRRSSPLGLRVETHGGDLVITWNRESREIRSARSGTLMITDGDQSRQEIHLDSAQLLNGSILYAPISGRVQFRLEVEGDSKASEFVLAIIRGREAAPGAVFSTATTKPGERVQSLPAVTALSAQEPVRQSLENRAATPRPSRTFVPPPAAGASEAQPRVFIVDPPAVKPEFSLAATPGPQAISQLRIPEPPPAAPASPSPAQIVPETKPAPRVSNYVQPRVLRREQPILPSVAFRTIITRDLAVEVVVSIDGSGKVTDARIVSGAVPTLISTTVLEAARRWTFVPASADGQPVPSETRIRFNFRPSRGPR